MTFLLHIDIKLWGLGGGWGEIDHEAEKESIQMITIKYCHEKKSSLKFLIIYMKLNTYIFVYVLLGYQIIWKHQSLYYFKKK